MCSTDWSLTLINSSPAMRVPSLSANPPVGRGREGEGQLVNWQVVVDLTCDCTGTGRHWQLEILGQRGERRTFEYFLYG